jgi:uncharacterized protein (TIGR04222 family)
MNPFDLPEANFLTLYAGVIVGGLLLALLLRWALRLPGPAGGEAPALPPYEAAYLSGGPARAVHAALASLLHRGLLTLGASTGRLYREADLPPDAHPLERALHSVEPGTLATRVVDLVRPETEALARQLEERGLVLTRSRSDFVRWLTGLLLVGVALLGGVRILVDLAEHRQPINVALACVVPVSGAVLAFLKRPDRSRRGDQVLGALRSRHEGLQEAARTNWETLSEQDVATVVGVFGPGVLTAGPLSHLRLVLNTADQTTDEVPMAPPGDSE